MDDQEPLERSRDVPAVLKRPDPLATETARPIQRGGKAALADLDRLISDSSPVAAATAAIVCDRLCMSAPSTIMTSSLHLD